MVPLGGSRVTKTRQYKEKREGWLWDLRFRDLCCVLCIEAVLGLRMIEEFYFYFALGILKTE